MRSWRAAGGCLSAAQAPRPLPGDDQILVRVDAAAITRPVLAGSRAAAVSGVVVGSGDNARHLDGARVALAASDPCGECDLCRRGDVFLCPHANARDAATPVAEYIVAAARWACRVDGDLSIPGPASALLPLEAGLAYQAFIRLNTAPGEPLLVLGHTAAGRLLVDIATARGAKVFAQRPSSQQFADDLARRGAHLLDDGESLATAAASAGLETLPWRVIDTAGSLASRRFALQAAGAGARLAMFAPAITGLAEDEPIALGAVLDRGISITSIAGAHPDLTPEVAAMAIKQELDLAAAIEEIGVDRLDSITADHIAAAEAAGQAIVARW